VYLILLTQLDALKTDRFSFYTMGVLSVGPELINTGGAVFGVSMLFFFK